MTPSELLIQKMRKARRVTVELDGGKKVFLLRPREEEALRMFSSGSVSSKDVCTYAEGWEGFTEADLLGPALGAGDLQVEFDPQIFSEWILDRADDLSKMVEAVAKAINEHFEKRAGVEKN